MKRIIIVGGPRRGKSHLAGELRAAAVFRHEPEPVVRCGDPASKVKQFVPGVEYLPEGLDFSGDGGASDWVRANWFTLPGPWICEGHVMARALRRWKDWLATLDDEQWQDAGCPRYPCDRIIVLSGLPRALSNPGQERMHKGVMKVWNEIAEYYFPLVEERQ